MGRLVLPAQAQGNLVEVGGDVILHPGIQPVDDVPEAGTFVVADQHFLFCRPLAGEGGLGVCFHHIAADLHEVAFKDIPTYGVIDVEHRPLVVQDKVQRRVEAVLDGADGGVGGDQRLHPLGGTW